MTAAEFALIGIDPATILECFSWGFGVVIFFWSMGFGLGVALDVIRRA